MAKIGERDYQPLLEIEDIVDRIEKYTNNLEEISKKETKTREEKEKEELYTNSIYYLIQRMVALIKRLKCKSLFDEYTKSNTIVQIEQHKSQIYPSLTIGNTIKSGKEYSSPEIKDTLSSVFIQIREEMDKEKAKK